MFYTAKNLLIKINDDNILSSEAQLTYEAQTEPYLEIGQRHADKITPTNTIQGSLNFSYYSTGIDPIKKLIQEDGPLAFDFGGLKQTGYLKSLNVRFAPHTPVISNAVINFFRSPTGKFNPIFNQTDLDKNIMHIDNVFLNNFNNRLITGNILNAIYSYDVDLIPEVHIGNIEEERCVFGLKQTTCTINFENLDPEIKVSGEKVGVQFTTKSFVDSDILDSYTCTGFLLRKNFQGRSDEILSSEITIKQYNLFALPQIEYIFPTTGTANTIVTIQGKNLKFTTNVFFDDEAAKFTIINDDTLKTIVPRLKKGPDVKISLTSLG